MQLGCGDPFAPAWQKSLLPSTRSIARWSQKHGMHQDTADYLWHAKNIRDDGTNVMEKGRRGRTDTTGPRHLPEDFNTAFSSCLFTLAIAYVSIRGPCGH